MMLIFILNANNDTNILILSEKKVNVPIIQFPSLKILCGSLFHSFIYLYKKSSSEKVNQKIFYIKKQTNKQGTQHTTHNTHKHREEI